MPILCRGCLASFTPVYGSCCPECGYDPKPKPQPLPIMKLSITFKDYALGQLRPRDDRHRTQVVDAIRDALQDNEDLREVAGTTITCAIEEDQELAIDVAGVTTHLRAASLAQRVSEAQKDVERARKLLQGVQESLEVLRKTSPGSVFQGVIRGAFLGTEQAINAYLIETGEPRDG